MLANYLRTAFAVFKRRPFFTIVSLFGITVTLAVLLIVTALMMMRKGKRFSLAAGAVLALAVLVKVNLIFLIPFLLLRRRWHVVLGFVAGCLVLLGLGLAVDGPDAVSDYAFTQLPRISEYGDSGTVEMALVSLVVAGLLASERLAERRSLGRAVLGGIILGLAVSVKAPGVLLALPLLHAAWGEDRPRSLARVGWIAAVAVALTLVLNPTLPEQRRWE